MSLKILYDYATISSRIPLQSGGRKCIRNRKTLQDLQFKDNFMFAAVMLQGDNARLVLERILGIKIRSARVIREKSIVFDPEYKGVRMDVYLDC